MTQERRVTKKIRLKQLSDDLFLEWLNDFRCYLLEADFENIDKCIIRKQFKRRLKRLKLRGVTVTRLDYYYRVATDRT